MKIFYIILFIILSLYIGCDKESEKSPTINITQGSIFGVITDKETGFPIKNAEVRIGNRTSKTDENGKYIIENIPFVENIEIVITAEKYKEYRTTVSLNQGLLSFNASLTPIYDPSEPILRVLDAVSKGIESLDPGKIPSIQSHFTKDYITGNDEATAFGIFVGVIPPNYDKIPETIINIVKKYDKLEFKFSNPEVKLGLDTATVMMRFIVNAETKPPEPKKWEIIIDGKFIFRKQDDEWKISFWGLIPPFLKFDERPL